MYGVKLVTVTEPQEFPPIGRSCAVLVAAEAKDGRLIPITIEKARSARIKNNEAWRVIEFFI